MKFKGLTKLALSGVALAAVAATLGTSTYAWYVSNTTATVSGAEGGTAGAETVGSLYAASKSMHTAGNWSNKVTLAGDGTDYTSVTNLVPATKATEAKTTAYNAKMAAADEDWTDVAPTEEFVDKAGEDLSTGAVLEFDFWLIQRGDKNALVTPSLTITNTTENKTTTQKAYTGSYLPGTGLKTNDTFKVDAVHALRIEITNSAVAADGTATTTSETTNVYLADRDFETYTSPTGFVAPGTGDANLYYDSLVNDINLYGCGAKTGTGNLCVSEVEGSASKWQAFYLKPDVETHLTFKIWLEGTDKDCFDSCVGQTFDFKFDFAL